jgi:hypothetical protein
MEATEAVGVFDAPTFYDSGNPTFDGAEHSEHRNGHSLNIT